MLSIRESLASQKTVEIKQINCVVKKQGDKSTRFTEKQQRSFKTETKTWSNALIKFPFATSRLRFCVTNSLFSISKYAQ